MGTTLVEELERAAEAAEHAMTSYYNASKDLEALEQLAARLRARAKRVAALERPACHGDCEHVDCFLYRALTGPLPATPPETPGDR